MSKTIEFCIRTGSIKMDLETTEAVFFALRIVFGLISEGVSPAKAIDAVVNSIEEGSGALSLETKAKTLREADWIADVMYKLIHRQRV